MTILVSDTTVILDLDRGEVLDSVFALNRPFAVSDLLYERELPNALRPRLTSLGLTVETLSEGEVAEAAGYRRQDTSLSLSDAFAFALARKRQWGVLVGEGGLRRAAIAHQLEVLGFFCILDRLEAENVCDCEVLAAALDKAARHPRSRLTRSEIEKRLNRYRSSRH